MSPLPPSRRRALSLVALLPGAAIAGCAPGSEPATEAGDSGPTSPDGTGTSGAGTSGEEATTIVSGLQAPWSIAFHAGSALVSERDSARILEVTEGGELREVGIVDGVTPRGEGGLMGLAVHDAHLFAYFTAGDENRLARFPLTGEPGALALGPAETLLDGIPAARVHHGGRLAIGPDEMLYVTVGDAGDAAQAQDPDTLLGTILRLTPDGGIPQDTPFPGSPVHSYGHRNPQGLAWDEDGTLYASEFGQDTWDELNVIEPGANHGWPEVEGRAEDPRFVDPVQQWTPEEASPSGIALAHGSLWIANLRGRRLREVPLSDLSTSREHLVGTHGRLRDVVVAPDGALWVLTNTTDGRGDPHPDGDRILRLDRS
nr:PQQ-dependent sugar dehydrogenase [Brachybacterium saurashtrense]